MKELFEKIRDSNLILLNEIIYSASKSIYIPLVEMDSNGMVWVYMEMRVINDLKRVIKKLDKANITWFYRSTGMTFNDDMLDNHNMRVNCEFILRSVFRQETWFRKHELDNMALLKGWDKLCAMVRYYNFESDFVDVVDSYRIFTDFPNMKDRKKGQFLYDPYNKIIETRRLFLLKTII